MSQGFKPPEPVWDIADSEELSGDDAPAGAAGYGPARKTSNVWKWIVGFVLFLLTGPTLAWLSQPSAQNQPREQPQNLGPGTCFDYQYTVRFDAVDGTGVVVPCNDPRSTYRRVATGAGRDCKALKVDGHHIEQQLDGGENACLIRVFNVGQCSPITTADIIKSTKMAQYLVVPCDAQTSNKYPAIVRITNVVQDRRDCGEWSWRTDSDDRRICVDISK